MLGSLAKDNELLANIRSKWSSLAELLEEMNSHWSYEDPIYRFYYESWKVYGLQDQTQVIVEALREITPSGTAFCPFFEEIIQAGVSGKRFDGEHNEQWTTHTRPFVEAFFHAKFFLEMAVKCGKELEEAPTTLPSGWAALLCLYDIR